MRQQRQLDVQFMLVRYRAAMDKDWSDDPNVKEPLNSLVDLQANMINLPETQMKGIRGEWRQQCRHRRRRHRCCVRRTIGPRPLASNPSPPPTCTTPLYRQGSAI